MEIRAMTPQETAQWCSSLALCGIKGGLLRSLQERILRQQIDGMQFDKMLKSNTLMDLGIEDLNPRLSLSIRRSWTTDFASVNFVDSSQSRPPQYAQPLQQQPQQPQEPQRLSAWDQDRMKNHPSRESQPPSGQPVVPRDHPSRQSVPGHRPWATYEDDPQPRSRAGGPSPAGNSVASSSMVRGGPPTPGPTDHFGNMPSRDLFGARPSVNSYDIPPYSGYGGTSPSMNEFGDSRAHGDYMRAGYDSQGYPDHRPRGQAVPPMGSPMGSTQGSMAGGRDANRWDEKLSMPPLDQTYDYRNVHRDVSPSDMRGAPREMRQSPMGGNMQGASWSGGLQDSLVPRKSNQNTYAADPAYDSIRPRGGGNTSQSPMHGWEGGLDDMLPPQSRLPANVAQPYAKAAREREQAQAEEMLRAQERAEAESRAAAEADAARFAQRPQSPHADFVQRHPRSGQGMREPDSEWGGASLGDTLEPKRYSTNGAVNDFDSRGPPRNEYDRRSIGNASMQYDRRAQDYDRGGFDDFEEQGAPRTSVSNRPSYANGGLGRDADNGFSRSGYENDEEDFCVQVKVPKSTPPGGNTRSPEPASRVPVKLEAQEQRQWSPPRPRSRQSAAPPVDNGWGGISLGDAFAKKPATTPSDAGGSSGSRAFPPRKGEAPTKSADGVGCNKSPDEIIAWVRSLPESHVPEKARQSLAAIIEERSLSGQEFTSYVKSVPPEICAPKNAMKLKAAWNNVLAEAACAEVARENARNQPTQKACAIVV